MTWFNSCYKLSNTAAPSLEGFDDVENSHTNSIFYTTSLKRLHGLGLQGLNINVLFLGSQVNADLNGNKAEKFLLLTENKD